MGPYHLIKKIAFMKPFDPPNTVIPWKKSVEFLSHPKKDSPSLYLRAKLRQDGVNGSTFLSILASMVNDARIWSKLASMALHLDPYRHQWFQNGLLERNLDPWTPNSIKFCSHWRKFGSKCGAIDADLDHILEPLMTIWIKMMSHWHG